MLIDTLLKRLNKSIEVIPLMRHDLEDPEIIKCVLVLVNLHELLAIDVDHLGFADVFQ